MTAEIISSLLMLVGGITILTNIIVQVVKSITGTKFPQTWLRCSYQRR